MPSLNIDNVPLPLFDQIQRLALARKRTPAEMALEVLESAFRITTPANFSARPPGEPFRADEIIAPFDIPQPPGERVQPQWISDYVPKPHDNPDEG